jgi:O-succinylbenzoate synthase
MALLRVRDEEGRVGLGEAVPLTLRGGATLSQVVGELEGIGKFEELDEAAIAGSGLSAPARCAALTALIDLRGKLAASDAGESGAPAPIDCNATLVSGEPAAVAADAERWAEEGFGTFKLKLGAGDDVGQVRAVRETLGPDARIRVDANGAWDVETATRTLRELEPLEIELAEQPVAAMGQLAEVAASTSIPISGDESVESREQAERARAAGACRVTGVKLAKVGGPEAAIEIAEVMTCYLSSALDGPVGIAAAAQVALTLQAGDEAARLAHGLATQRLFASTIASTECELRGGVLHPPPGPGLGVEIDEEALQAHRL